MRSLLASLPILIAIHSASAMAQQKEVSGVFAAPITCSEYREARLADPTDSRVFPVVAWIWGFLSCHNSWAASSEAYIPSSKDDVLTYVDYFCDKNPDAYTASAVEDILEGSGDSRLTRYEFVPDAKNGRQAKN